MQIKNLTNKLTLNSLPNDKILDWPSYKALADHNLNMKSKIEICTG